MLKRMISHGLAVVMAAHSVAVQAETTTLPTVYRCDHDHGVVEFSDRYCGVNAVVQALRPLGDTGVAMGSTGDYAAITAANRMRDKRRGVAAANERLQKLSREYAATLAQLEQQLQELPNNALRKSTQRDIHAGIAQLKREYVASKRAIEKQLSAVRQR